MLTDFKFWYVRRISDEDVGRLGDGKHGEPGRILTPADVGLITEVTVRFYEGAITTETEDTPDGPQPVTRYRRRRRVRPREVPGRALRATDEASGQKAYRYTRLDFGDTKDIADVEAYLKRELAADLTRTPVPAQVLTAHERSRLEARHV